MSKLCLSLAGLVVAFTVTVFADERGRSAKVKTVPDGLEGTWELIAEVVNGELSDRPSTTLVITGDAWQTRGLIKEHYPGMHDQVPGYSLRGSEFMIKHRVGYRPEVASNAFDYLPEGSMETDQGDLIPSMFGKDSKPSIFRIRGDLLEICERTQPVDNEPARPSKFVSTTDSNLSLRVYRRVSVRKTQTRPMKDVRRESSSKVDESRIESLEIEDAHVTVKGNRMTIKGGTVTLDLK